MKILEPKQISINYPIVPASAFHHHTDDLEQILTRLICEIHETADNEKDDLLSHSTYMLGLSIRITSILACYQGDLIHSNVPNEDDEHPDYF